MFLVSSLLLARFIYIYPLSPAFDWAQASDSFLYIIMAASIAFFSYMTISWSFSLALILFLLSSGVSSVAEILGLSSGLTFGTLYHYHPDIATRITEQLPLAIPLAWFIFCCIPLMLLRPWLLSDHTGAGLSASGAPRRGMLGRQVVACSALLTSCDLFLEPLSVYTGYWTWARQGYYFGAPVMNFLGWFWVGLIVFSSFFYIKNRWFRHVTTAHNHLDRYLIWLFLFWIIVALMLIGYQFNSLVPLWLTSMMMGPLLYLRVWKERQIKADFKVSKNQRNGTG